MLGLEVVAITLGHTVRKYWYLWSKIAKVIDDTFLVCFDRDFTIAFCLVLLSKYLAVSSKNSAGILIGILIGFLNGILIGILIGILNRILIGIVIGIVIGFLNGILIGIINRILIGIIIEIIIWILNGMPESSERRN